MNYIKCIKSDATEELLGNTPDTPAHLFMASKAKKCTNEMHDMYPLNL